MSALHFAFIDESHHPCTGLFSLTGVFIPAAKLNQVRNDFYGILRPFMQPEPRRIEPPPELHGAELLPNETDETKLDVLRQVVGLQKEHQLGVLRVGMPRPAGLPDVFGSDDNMYGLTWSNFVQHLQGRLAEGVVVPVMDMMSAERGRQMSGPLQFHQAMRAIGFEGDLSVRGTENLVGEVFYADSKYASMIQFADLLSYVLNVADVSDEGYELTGFKQGILSIADELEGELVERHIVTLRRMSDGKPISPGS